MTSASEFHVKTKKKKKEISTWQRRLSIVVPAFNEKAGIGATVTELKRCFPLSEIIIVDDGSTDGTVDAISDFDGITIIQHFTNRGYGSAIKTGMIYSNREYVAWFDADNEHQTADLHRIMERLHQEQLVAVIGERKELGPSLLRNVGKFIITQLGRSMQIKIGADLNCGLRAFKKEIILNYVSLLPDGYSASMTSLIIMLQRNYPIKFEPVTVNSRLGQSKVRLVDGVKTIFLLLRTIMLFAPLRIFLGAGALLIVLGFAYSVRMLMLVGVGLPVFGAMVMLIGFMTCMIGLLADQISQMRLSSFENSVEVFARVVKTS